MLPIIDLLIACGADPNILPVGRIDWDEFVPLHSVLLRLSSAGYKKLEVDDETEDDIRQEFQLRKQRSVPDQSAVSLTGESASPELGQPVSQTMYSGPGPSTYVSNTLAPSTAPTQQTNDNKRKARSSRVDWWKRLIGRK
ncbi:uncharacterized protein B0J16DRAFT_336495 [Fusarium flagelliforme]|uniref:uncharacterized protein n=1 Tax=Fusarium flagelliforme TaxID=2675880 RepID=UPI001E8DAD62|nr:uncharacterized protein B0J16DRAFT_336495 [Fusarium flagelliforme]KAH7188141.1 hypothetical protein B0J16DRAFT_336495 [Fusarium flagelliforme]